MCRYAMTLYKPHYACFNCRKTFKRRLMWDIRRDDKSEETPGKCPQCQQPMVNIGKDFEAPKQTDIKAWSHIKTLYTVGITFHSCGCTGPGYIPNDKERLTAYFEDLLRDYQCNLEFWRERTEPTNEREEQRDTSKNWDHISQLPGSIRPKKGAVTNEDAKNFWIGRIKEVENKLAGLIS